MVLRLVAVLGGIYFLPRLSSPPDPVASPAADPHNPDDSGNRKNPCLGPAGRFSGNRCGNHDRCIPVLPEILQTPGGFMNPRHPLISIIIPNWNGRRFLEICLPSLRRQTFGNFSVIVVDNGSQDGSVEWMREAFPEMDVLELPENRGFGGGVNAGILRSKSPLIFLLNNDTELAPECLDQLVDAAAIWPEADSFAPKMLDFFDRSRLDGTGDGIFRGGAGYRIGTGEPDELRFNIPMPVFGACAGAALYRRRFFERAGLFDADFFAYLEDVDLNLHACRMGLICRYVPSARVFHMGSMTSGSRLNPFVVRLTSRNLVQVVVKNYPVPILAAQFPVIFLYQAYWMGLCVFRRLGGAYVRGIADAWRQLPLLMHKRRERMAAHPVDHRFWHAVRLSEHDVMVSIIRKRKQAGRSTRIIEWYLRWFLRVA
jgi:hypothetical protein